MSAGGPPGETEDAAARGRRHFQRGLFDGAAELSWPADERRRFQAGLRQLPGSADASLTLESSVTMARAARA